MSSSHSLNSMPPSILDRSVYSDGPSIRLSGNAAPSWSANCTLPRFDSAILLSLQNSPCLTPAPAIRTSIKLSRKISRTVCSNLCNLPIHKSSGPALSR